VADRELPPLRVKLIGDDSSYRTMMERAAKQADDLAKKVGAAGRNAAGGGKGGGFFNAQEQAIFDRMRLEERAAATLEKLTLRRMRLQEYIAKREEKRLFSQMQQAEQAAKAEESRLFALMQLESKRARREERRLFAQMQLSEKAAKAEEARLFTLMQLTEKRAKAEEARVFSQMQLAEKAARQEEARLFSQMQTWERIEQRKQAAARQESERAERRMRTEETHVQRMANMRATQQRASDAAQQRSQQSAQSHQQRSQQSAQSHQQRMSDRQAASIRAADAAQQRSQQSAQMHQQRLYNAQQSQQRAADAAQQRSQQSAQMHQQRLYNAQQSQQRAANAATQRSQQSAQAHQQRSQQSAQMHQQRMHASQSAINRQNALAWNRLRQSQQRHAQMLFNSAVANRRQNAAAQQRLAAGAARMQQTAAQAAQNLNNNNALAQQRLANAQMTQYRQNAQTQQRMHQAAQMHQARMARQAQILANGGRRGGGGGGGMGLGGRADIYMGMHAMRGVMGAIAGPAQDAMNWQDAQIALTAYTGSAEEAKKTLAEVQEFSLASPYTSANLIDQAKSMMAYGMSSEKTMQTLKQLGAVAGGNENRMQLLSYAMAQVNSTGILQGQELRQLTESGFNPLMIMAKEMTNTEEEAAEKFKELRKAMSEGRITADMVSAALQNATAKGGMFAGILAELNDSTRGLTNQLLEYFSLIQRNIFASIQDELDEFLKVGVAYMKMISDWITANPEAAKSIGKIIWNVIIGITAVLAFTVAVAGLRWMFGALLPIMYLVQGAFWLLTTGATAAWTAITSPVGIVIAAILAVAAAIALIIAYFYHPGGVIGAFGDMMRMAHQALMYTLGFFWNFGENIQKLFAWMGDNWSQMWINMFASMRVTWNNISGWLADRILEVSWMFGGLTDEQLEGAKKARADATERQNKEMESGTKPLPAFDFNTTLPSFETPTYDPSAEEAEDKVIVDYEAMMGEAKSAAGGRGGASSDITAAARGSSEAEQRARAFMAGNRVVSTNDPKAKREARMERFLKDIERNTRQPANFPVGNIA
jgi:hypothetical protein